MVGRAGPPTAREGARVYRLGPGEGWTTPQQKERAGFIYIYIYICCVQCMTNILDSQVTSGGFPQKLRRSDQSIDALLCVLLRHLLVFLRRHSLRKVVPRFSCGRYRQQRSSFSLLPHYAHDAMLKMYYALE